MPAQGNSADTPQLINPAFPEEPKREALRGKLTTVAIVTTTLVLAGISIFTATRLYRLRKRAVAPTTPESKPKAQEEPRQQTPSPTSPLIAQASPSPTPTATSTATPIPTGSPTPSPSPSPTTAPSPSPTGQPELPAAGAALPTITGVAIGLSLLIASLLLAL